MICSGCRDGSAFGVGEHRQPMAGEARGRREERRDREALDLAESSEAETWGLGSMVCRGLEAAGLTNCN